MKTIVLVGAALGMAGCVCCSDCCKASAKGLEGSWGLKLPYANCSAGHMIVSRDAEGKPKALVLWRYSSPIDIKGFTVDGNRFSFDHPWGFSVCGSFDGDKIVGRVTGTKNKKVIGEIVGWRNAEIESANTADAKFGEPIDLLKDGLDGWQVMEPQQKFGWSFKDGVLSNKLGLKKDGSWAGGGANLMTKRADFTDFNLDYDVRVPTNSNSGVYLRGRYEIQVVDSYGKPLDPHNMAAYYGRACPSVAAEKPAGEWQHVNVTLYKRHLTVILNGQKIIDNVPVVGITGGAIDANEFVPGPIYLQGDHSDADYKNMILRPAL